MMFWKQTISSILKHFDKNCSFYLYDTILNGTPFPWIVDLYYIVWDTPGICPFSLHVAFYSQKFKNN